MTDVATKQWYVVHTYSGYEHKVKASLEERIRSLSKPDLFGEILVPSEKVVELVKGKKKTSSRKFFPGYILVNMRLNNETWHIVKSTPKVTGFLGGATDTGFLDRHDTTSSLAGDDTVRLSALAAALAGAAVHRATAKVLREKAQAIAALPVNDDAVSERVNQALMAVSRAPRRPRKTPLTSSRWISAPRRPRRVVKPSASMRNTEVKFWCARLR